MTKSKYQRSTKTYPKDGFQKLLCDKLDRLIIFFTENEDAPYLKMADYKEKYGSCSSCNR